MKPRAGRGAVPKPVAFPIVVGSVVYAPIKATKGVTKRRPCVVLMATPAVEDHFIVIGITSDGGNYDPADTRGYPPDLYFPIPSSPDGSSATGLLRRCAAYAEFVQDFARSEMAGTAGFVDATVLNALTAWIRAYIRNQQGR